MSTVMTDDDKRQWEYFTTVAMPWQHLHIRLRSAALAAFVIIQIGLLAVGYYAASTSVISVPRTGEAKITPGGSAVVINMDSPNVILKRNSSWLVSLIGLACCVACFLWDSRCSTIITDVHRLGLKLADRFECPFGVQTQSIDEVHSTVVGTLTATFGFVWLWLWAATLIVITAIVLVVGAVLWYGIAWFRERRNTRNVAATSHVAYTVCPPPTSSSSSATGSPNGSSSEKSDDSNGPIPLA